ncbi:MAG: hypothetical protein QF545_01805 [Candidatus Thalassarchaeaceae archaeon]|jgi:hypothetical protein|nr:hypothetical protein [Candidatus Thalassarchaeaceae archaeon]MDP7003593.1 hypothetical protein [Candidatus Thalassarchaeaceae archaeon]
MAGMGSLPGRSEVGGRVFSPWIDRVSLVLTVVAAVIAAPEISSFLEEWLGGSAMTATVCGLMIIVPLFATSLGKLVVRLQI